MCLLCTLVCGVGWDPALFTRSLDEKPLAGPKLLSLSNRRGTGHAAAAATSGGEAATARRAPRRALPLQQHLVAASQAATGVGSVPSYASPTEVTTSAQSQRAAAQRPRRRTRGRSGNERRRGRRGARRAAAGTATAAAPRCGVTGGRRLRQRPSLCVADRPGTVAGRASATPAGRMALALLSAFQPAWRRRGWLAMMLCPRLARLPAGWPLLSCQASLLRHLQQRLPSPHLDPFTEESLFLCVRAYPSM